MSIIGDGLDILKLLNKGANADLYSKIGKLIDDAQDLYKEREQLQRENKALQDQLAFKGRMQRLGSWVFEDGDDYPICSRCAEVDNRPVHLTYLRGPQGDYSRCPQCKAERRRFLRKAQVEEMLAQGNSV